MDLVVMKFGGTSVQDVPALGRLVDIVRAETRPKVVVVSALAGVTDALSALGTSGERLDLLEKPTGVTDALCARHEEIVRALVRTEAQDGLIERIRLRFAAAATIAGAEGGVTPRDRDALLAIGELASSEVVAAVLASTGVAAAWADARRVIVTDAAFGHAKPDAASTREAASCELLPLLSAGRVPVIGGFVAATVTGLTTTLGRGGSDYSAALIGAALDACEIQIWTDVDGVLSADPRVVADPVLVPQLTFREAYELARFGAKVLHWGTLEPAAVHDIPVRVLNARRSHARGTMISASRNRSEAGVSGLAYQPRVHLAELMPAAVAGCLQFVRAATEWLDRQGRRLTVVCLSPSRLVVSAAEASAVRELVSGLGGIAQARVQHDCGLVTVVATGAAASASVWASIAAEQTRGRLLEAFPAQSGDAVACVIPPGAGARVFHDLHAALVHRDSARLAAAILPSLATSTDRHLGTQSIVGA
jgi:aspartate kinase